MKVLLHGYAQGNLGDDLFFRVIAERYPQVQFTLPVLEEGYRENFSDLSNLHVKTFPLLKKVFREKAFALPKLYSFLHLRHYDAVVCIGGSLFIDTPSPGPKHRKEIEQYSFIHDWRIARFWHVPYFVLGANWGPCYNNYFRNFFSKAFASLEDLCFRDRASFALFRNLPNVRYSGDILLGCPLLKEAIQSGLVKNRQIAISIIHPAHKGHSMQEAEQYFIKVAELATAFQKQGYAVRLLSFCQREGDEEAMREIISRMPHRQEVVSISYHGNWQEIFRQLAESEVILASRFHATVLGWTLGTRVFSLYYSDKTKALLEDCRLTASGRAMEANLKQLTLEEVLAHAACLDSPQRLGGWNGAFQKLDQLVAAKEKL